MAAKPLFRSLSLALILLTLWGQVFATETAAQPTLQTTPPAVQAITATAALPDAAPQEQAPAPGRNAVQALAQSVSHSVSQSVSQTFSFARSSGGALPARAESILGKLGHYTEHAQEIVKSGFNYMGVLYRRGGTSAETGFDCSGLVRRVFGDAFGLELPHNARAISQEGTKISVKDLKPGDLVFFNTLRKTFSHVGIYVGNNLFLHAPSSGGGVRLDDLRERYWVKRFNGARRIETE